MEDQLTFNCGKCGKQFPNKHKQDRHAKRKTDCTPGAKDVLTKHKCEYCDLMSTTKGNLKKHLTVCKKRPAEEKDMVHKLQDELNELKKTVAQLLERMTLMESAPKVVNNNDITLLTKEVIELRKIVEGKSEYIYFIVEEPYSDKVKIGKTGRSVERRISQLQTGNGNKLALYYKAVRDRNENFERKLHKKYKNRLIMGEWFKFTLEELHELISTLD